MKHTFSQVIHNETFHSNVCYDNIVSKCFISVIKLPEQLTRVLFFCVSEGILWPNSAVCTLKMSM